MTGRDAEELGRAVKLMRQRAEAVPPGPWTYRHELYSDGNGAILSDSPDVEGWGVLVTDIPLETGSRERGEHFASWDPGVTEAVADLLETAAAWTSAVDSRPGWVLDALAIARAYLGESGQVTP